MLAVDIGNTFTRIAAFRGDKISARQSFHTRDLDIDVLVPALALLGEQVGADKAWIASVSPGVNALMDSAAERAGLARHFIKPATDFIMPHALSTPQTTGVDRLLSAMAAGRRHLIRAEREKGYVVVQCGSAATVDLVDGNGLFRGGYILPGPTLWLLGVSAAAQLPDLSGEMPDWKAVWAGDNTRDAIMHGMQAALPMSVASAAMFISTKEDGVVSEAPGLPVVVTGGWGEAVLAYIQGHHIYDRDLLLHGIRYFAELNP